LVVIDDHPLFREGVVYTLSREPDFKVVGTGGCAADAVRLAREAKPDVALLDVSMPGGGLAAAREISTATPNVQTVFLTVSEEAHTVESALAAGVRGYILKGIGGADLVRTIRAIASGETYITPDFAARLLASKPAPVAVAGHDPVSLSAREKHILREVARGQTNKEIAKKFDLSEKTIKHYMSAVLQKLGARNRIEAVNACQKSPGILLDSPHREAPPPPKLAEHKLAH
jgi:DNA-binding NarL/FixJ family response regulator